MLNDNIRKQIVGIISDYFDGLKVVDEKAQTVVYILNHGEIETLASDALALEVTNNNKLLYKCGHRLLLPWYSIQNSIQILAKRDEDFNMRVYTSELCVSDVESILNCVTEWALDFSGWKRGAVAESLNNA